MVGVGGIFPFLLSLSLFLVVRPFFPLYIMLSDLPFRTNLILYYSDFFSRSNLKLPKTYNKFHKIINRCFYGEKILFRWSSVYSCLFLMRHCHTSYWRSPSHLTSTPFRSVSPKMIRSIPFYSRTWSRKYKPHFLLPYLKLSINLPFWPLGFTGCPTTLTLQWLLPPWR